MGEVGLLRMEVLQVEPVEPILTVIVEMLLCLSGMIPKRL